MAFSLPFPAALLGTNVQGDVGPLTCYTSTPGRTVYFLKAPPKEPPSPRQCHVLAKWIALADLWRCIAQAQREAWAAAARAARLRITGYNLFVWYQMTKDIGPIHTIERQTGVKLLA
jgi:hypothetical protein